MLLLLMESTLVPVVVEQRPAASFQVRSDRVNFANTYLAGTLPSALYPTAGLDPATNTSAEGSNIAVE